jgi:hypothetical protein
MRRNECRRRERAAARCGGIRLRQGDGLQPRRILRQVLVRRAGRTMPTAADRVRRSCRACLWVRRRQLLERLRTAARGRCGKQHGRVHHAVRTLRRHQGNGVSRPRGVLRQAPSIFRAMLSDDFGCVLGTSTALSARRRRSGLGELWVSGVPGYLLGYPDRSAVSVPLVLPMTPLFVVGEQRLLNREATRRGARSSSGRR